jgi:hypothetical protein
VVSLSQEVTMAHIITIILLVAGLVCFLISAFGVAMPTRWNLVALGLACWITTALIAAAA